MVGLLYRSMDGGRHWQQLDAGYDGSLFGALALDTDTLVTFGLRGNLFLSRDRGDSWQRLVIAGDPGLSLYDAALAGDGEMIAVGAGGIILAGEGLPPSLDASIDDSRDVLAAVLPLGNGQALAVGMQGLRRIQVGSR